MASKISSSLLAVLLTLAASRAMAQLQAPGASVPAQPRPGPILSAENLSQVSAHVWTIKGSPNVGIVVGKQGTLVVDSGLGTANGRTVSEIALGLSPKGQKLYLTTTHYHAEHATGDGGFPSETVLVRPRAQQAELETEDYKLIEVFRGRSEEARSLLQDYRYLRPQILYDRTFQLDLGGVQVTLSWLGPAHTKGDQLVRVEPDSVLISGDIVQNKAGPYFYCSECTPRKWLAVLDQLARQPPPRIVLPDHSAPGDGSLIAEYRAFLAELAARVDALKREGRSAEEAGRILTAEMQAKYPGWSSLNRIPQGVANSYAPGNN